MAKTNAQRQAEFKARQQTAGEKGKRKVELWVSTGAALALKRLARHHDMTQGLCLDRLLLGTQEVITAGMTDEEHEKFFAVT